MKLYAVYIGGSMADANIELHDMRFVIGENIESTYAELRRQWWGTPSSLHLDCWAELNQADGYKISLHSEPMLSTKQLYYVNLGGYDGSFTEAHKNLFIVAESEIEAKTRALATVKNWLAPHKDNIYEAEQCFALRKIAKEHRLYIHLEKIADLSQPAFICRYKNIGRLEK